MIRRYDELKKHHQLIFSLLIVTGVTCVWRGIWGILDIYLFPGVPILSYVLSFIIGVLVIAGTHYTVDSVV